MVDRLLSELPPLKIRRPDAPADTVLTIAEPIDGVWQLSLTRGGEELVTSFGPLVGALGAHGDPAGITLDTDSDAAAAAEHAVDLLLEDFGITVTTIAYPDGQTVVC